MTPKNNNLPRKDLLQYSMLAIPIAFAGMPLYVHAPDYYATEFSLSLSSIGLALLFLRIIDAIQDPIIGRLSDNFSKKRFIIIIGSTVILVSSFFGLFQPFLEVNKLFWFALMMFLATTAFSIISINLNTFGSLWTKNKYQKTRITSTREAFGLVGLLMAVILPSAFMQNLSKADSFLFVSGILFLITFVGLVAFFKWNKKHKVSVQKKGIIPQASIIKTIRNMPSETRYFFMIYGISMLASAIPAILVMFFIRDRLDSENYTGLFLSLYFLSGAAGMPIWQYLSKRWNKNRAWLCATLLAVVSFIWAYFLGAGDIWQYAAICVFSGIAFGADLALPPSILADHIHKQNSEQSASLQFGVFAFLAKAALAIAAVIIFPLLEQSGFQAGKENTKESLATLSISYAAIPCFIKLISAWLLFKISGENDEKDYINIRSSNA